MKLQKLNESNFQTLQKKQMSNVIGGTSEYRYTSTVTSGGSSDRITEKYITDQEGNADWVVVGSNTANDSVRAIS